MKFNMNKRLYKATYTYGDDQEQMYEYFGAFDIDNALSVIHSYLDQGQEQNGNEIISIVEVSACYIEIEKIEV